MCKRTNTISKVRIKIVQSFLLSCHFCLIHIREIIRALFLLFTHTGNHVFANLSISELFFFFSVFVINSCFCVNAKLNVNRTN